MNNIRDYYVLRHETTNKFFLFKNRPAFVKWYRANQSVASEYHFQNNSTGSSQLFFDIDVDQDSIDTFKFQGLTIDSMISDIKKALKIEFDPHVVDRCRQDKLSWHVFFPVNTHLQVLKHLIA